MKTTTPTFRSRRISRKGQRGVTLFFGMLFLLTIVLLTLGGVAMSRYQQRLALAMNDREVAFQSATLALRAAELNIYFTRSDKSPDTASRLNGETLQTPSLDACLTTTIENLNKSGSRCSIASIKDSVFTNSNITWDKTISPLQGLEANIPKDTKEPKYIIEDLKDNDRADSPTEYTRITAIGYGRFNQTQVRLEEVYRFDETENPGK